jgi:hypothetical protein
VVKAQPATPIEPIDWNVNEFVLIRSTPPNPYEILQRYALKGEPLKPPPEQLGLL